MSNSAKYVERVRTQVETSPDSYAAFISYSRAVDGLLAPKIQTGLQQFSKPWYQLRALRIFRDDASLNANPGLWSSIQHSLDHSEYLILLASPRAAQSEWVAKEVSYWLEHKPLINILIVCTEGELPWDTRRTGLPQVNALPQPLQGMYAEAPRFVDLRANPAGAHLSAEAVQKLSLTDPRFRECIADLAAPLHHVSKDNLLNEEILQHRAAIRLRNGAIFILVVLLLAAIAAAGYAFQQRQVALQQQQIAQQQRQIALEQLDTAVSRQLAATANLQSGADPQLAALLSVAAMKRKDTPEARTNLLQEIGYFQNIDRTFDNGGNQNGLAYSRDGTRLVSAGKSAVVWDAATGKKLLEVPGFRKAVISPDGGTLIAVNAQGIEMWDVNRRAKLSTFSLAAYTRFIQGSAGDIALSPDGRLLAVAGFKSLDTERGSEILLWNVQDRSVHGILKDPEIEGSFIIAFSPDGNTLASVDESREGPMLISLWDVSQKVRKASLSGPYEAGIFSMAFSRDGHLLATGDHRRQIVLWDLNDNTVLDTFQALGDVYGLAFSPDGETLASADNGNTLLLWDLNSHSQRGKLVGQLGSVQSLVYSPDGSTLASASDSGSTFLWNMNPDGQKNILLKKSIPRDLNKSFTAFSPDSQTIAQAGANDVTLWDMNHDQPLATLAGVTGPLVFLKGGQTLATTDGGKNIILWDMKTHQRQRTLTSQDDLSSEAQFSPDGRFLGVMNKEGLAVWDYLQNRRIVIPFDTLMTGGGSFAFSQDGKVVVLAVMSTIGLYDTSQVKSLYKLSVDYSSSPQMGLAFSPDGKTLATGVNESANTAEGCYGCKTIFWNLAQRTASSTIPFLSNGMAYSPDGSMLAMNIDGKIILWSVPQNAQMGAVADGSEVLSFSPNGKMLAAIGSTTVDIWDIDFNAWLKRMCAVAGRDMTKNEWSFYIQDRPYQSTCIP